MFDSIYICVRHLGQQLNDVTPAISQTYTPEINKAPYCSSLNRWSFTFICDKHLCFRTAEALLTPKVLVGISHDDYESLASSVIFSLCDSGVTRTAPSVDTGLQCSSRNDNSGSGQCSGDVRTVSDRDHGDFVGGGTEDPKRSGLPEVRTSAVTPDMSLVLPDKSLSGGEETKTASGQTTSSEDSWVMPSM